MRAANPGAEPHRGTATRRHDDRVPGRIAKLIFEVAEQAVCCEPVSGLSSLLTGKNTGIGANFSIGLMAQGQFKPIPVGILSIVSLNWPETNQGMGTALSGIVRSPISECLAAVEPLRCPNKFSMSAFVQ